jgi:hypothetical protein
MEASILILKGVGGSGKIASEWPVIGKALGPTTGVISALCIWIWQRTKGRGRSGARVLIVSLRSGGACIAEDYGIGFYVGADH